MTRFLAYRFLFFLIAIFGVNSLHGQVKISGYITDATSGETIVGAYIITSQSKITSSNIYGYYSLVIDTVPDTITFSMIGYVDQTKVIKSGQTKSLDIALEPKQYNIDQVDVVGTKVAKKEELDVVNIPMRRLKVVPNFLGEQDVMKIISLSPGVANGKEGTSGLYVRGGTPDQNTILLDGAKMYNSDHLFGYLSAFNPDAIQSFSIYKADFPTRFGGNLSSVIDVDIKDGNNKEKNKELSVGMLASRLLLEGPIKKDTSSYMIAGRFGYWTLASLPLLYKYLQAKNGRGTSSNSSFDEIQVYPNYFLYDINAKFTTKLQNNDKLFVSLYSGNDFILLKPFPNQPFSSNEVNLKWGTRTFSTKYTHLSKNNLFSELAFNLSDYKYNLLNENIENNGNNASEARKKRTSKSRSGLKDLVISSNNTYDVSANYRLNFGYSFIHHIQKQFYTGSIDDSTTHDAKSKSSQQEHIFYLENKFDLSRRWNTKVGVRLPLFVTYNKNYFNPEPRLNLSYAINESSVLKISYSRMTQPLHLLGNAAHYDGFRNDIWVSSSDNIAPQRSDQWSMGWINQLPRTNLEVKVEAYYKEFNNLIDYKEGYNFIETTTSYEKNIETNGQGKAYGLELFVNKTEGRFTGWLSYSLSWSKRKFEEINLGRWYHHRYSRMHDLSITASYQLKNERRLSSTFIFASGTRITLPSSLYQQSSGAIGARYDERNNFVFPNYHRLDLSFTRKVTTRKKKRDAYWTYSIYNVYAQKNPSVYYFRRYNSQSATGGTNNFNNNILGFNIMQRTHITFFPSISYRLKF